MKDPKKKQLFEQNVERLIVLSVSPVTLHSCLFIRSREPECQRERVQTAGRFHVSMVIKQDVASDLLPTQAWVRPWRLPRNEADRLPATAKRRARNHNKYLTRRFRLITMETTSKMGDCTSPDVAMFFFHDSGSVTPERSAAESATRISLFCAFCGRKQAAGRWRKVHVVRNNDPRRHKRTHHPTSCFLHGCVHA